MISQAASGVCCAVAPKRMWRWFAAALLVLCGTLLFLPRQSSLPHSQHDAGREGAELTGNPTWADGQRVVAVTEAAAGPNIASRQGPASCWTVAPEEVRQTVTMEHRHHFGYSEELMQDTHEALAGALHTRPGFAETELWRRLFTTDDNSTLVRIVVFGGSTVAGHDCEGPGRGSGTTCAYPARLARVLRRLFPSVRFAIHNLASGGVDSTVALGLVDSWFLQLGDKVPDVVICDFTTNDVGEFRPPTPWAFVAARAPQQQSSGIDRKTVGAVTEALVRKLQRLAPNAAKLFVVDPFQPRQVDSDAIFFAATEVLRHYGVPYADLRTLSRASRWRVWVGDENREVVAAWQERQGDRAPKQLMLAIGVYDGAHPAYEVQDAIGEMLGQAFWLLHSRMCSTTASLRERRDGAHSVEVSPCDGRGGEKVAKESVDVPWLFPLSESLSRVPTYVVSAFRPDADRNPAVGWTLHTGVHADKPGWISTMRGATWTIPLPDEALRGLRSGSVTQSRVPVALVITVLRSNRAVGRAAVRCCSSGSAKARTFTINARWTRQHSVNSLIRVGLGRNRLFDGEEFAFPDVPEANATLTVEFLGPPGTMFKLIAVSIV